MLLRISDCLCASRTKGKHRKFMAVCGPTQDFVAVDVLWKKQRTYIYLTKFKVCHQLSHPSTVQILSDFSPVEYCSNKCTCTFCTLHQIHQTSVFFCAKYYMITTNAFSIKPDPCRPGYCDYTKIYQRRIISSVRLHVKPIYSDSIGGRLRPK